MPKGIYPRRPPRPAEDRFWERVQKTATCWLWFGLVNGKGYGLFSLRNNHVRAHRFSWALHHGPIPEGLLVCHRCDVPNCVNPEHLFLGTEADNTTDMIVKGRQATGAKVSSPGEAHPMSKLTDAQVIAIRSDARKPSVIAEHYGVVYTTIWAIKTRRTWPHLKEASD